MIERIFGSLVNRHMQENAAAKAAQNAADIEYIAMMVDVDLDIDREDGDSSDSSEIEEV